MNHLLTHLHVIIIFVYAQTFSKAATKARAMTSRKLLTEEEHAELLGLFKQSTMGDGNIWKMFSKLHDDEKFV